MSANEEKELNRAQRARAPPPGGGLAGWRRHQVATLTSCRRCKARRRSVSGGLGTNSSTNYTNALRLIHQRRRSHLVFHTCCTLLHVREPLGHDSAACVCCCVALSGRTRGGVGGSLQSGRGGGLFFGSDPTQTSGVLKYQDKLLLKVV